MIRGEATGLLSPKAGLHWCPMISYPPCKLAAMNTVQRPAQQSRAEMMEAAGSDRPVLLSTCLHTDKPFLPACAPSDVPSYDVDQESSQSVAASTERK